MAGCFSDFSRRVNATASQDTHALTATTLSLEGLIESPVENNLSTNYITRSNQTTHPVQRCSLSERAFRTVAPERMFDWCRDMREPIEGRTPQTGERGQA